MSGEKKIKLGELAEEEIFMFPSAEPDVERNKYIKVVCDIWIPRKGFDFSLVALFKPGEKFKGEQGYVISNKILVARVKK